MIVILLIFIKIFDLGNLAGFQGIFKPNPLL